MGNSELDRLLDLYYRGEAGTDEEARLREILEKDDLSAVYLPEKEMFNAYASGDDIPGPSTGFEDSIMERIDLEEKRVSLSAIKHKIYAAVAVAASILIIISTYFVVFTNSRPADTFSDPLLAYEQTLEVFRLVSVGFNSASDRMTDLAYINQATESIEIIGKANVTVSKQLEPIGYFDMALRLVGKSTGGQNESE